MKVRYLLFTAIALFTMSACNNKKLDPAKLPAEPEFIIKTTEGDIRIKLYENTPLHRENFINLVSDKFYNDIKFHRVIEGFMIQIGDPKTKTKYNPEKESIDADYTIPAEFVQGYKHKLGALAAARRGDDVNPKKASSGTQFYIVQSEDGCRHLNGNYTVFGETLEGFDVIDKIAKTDKKGSVPIKDIRIISIKLAE